MLCVSSWQRKNRILCNGTGDCVWCGNVLIHSRLSVEMERKKERYEETGKNECNAYFRSKENTI